jgi:hypothetical protein
MIPNGLKRPGPEVASESEPLAKKRKIDSKPSLKAIAKANWQNNIPLINGRSYFSNSIEKNLENLKILTPIVKKSLKHSVELPEIDIIMNKCIAFLGSLPMGESSLKAHSICKEMFSGTPSIKIRLANKNEKSINHYENKILTNTTGRELFKTSISTANIEGETQEPEDFCDASLNEFELLFQMIIDNDYNVLNSLSPEDVLEFYKAKKDNLQEQSKLSILLELVQGSSATQLGDYPEKLQTCLFDRLFDLLETRLSDEEFVRAFIEIEDIFNDTNDEVMYNPSTLIENKYHHQRDCILRNEKTVLRIKLSNEEIFDLNLYDLERLRKGSKYFNALLSGKYRALNRMYEFSPPETSLEGLGISANAFSRLLKILSGAPLIYKHSRSIDKKLIDLKLWSQENRRRDSGEGDSNSTIIGLHFSVIIAMSYLGIKEVKLYEEYWGNYLDELFSAHDEELEDGGLEEAAILNLEERAQILYDIQRELAKSEIVNDAIESAILEVKEKVEAST